MNKEFIKIEKCEIIDSSISISYEVSESLKKYFKEKKMMISYTVDNSPLKLSDLPQSIAIIPFVCNVLPIIWICNAALIIKELDEDFYESIAEFKKGYVEMFPDVNFTGRVVVEKYVRNHMPDGNIKRENIGIFFSAGLDSYATLVNHINEGPDLISVWGSDISYNNAEGWEVLHRVLMTEAGKLRLPLIVIHSNFREIICERKLSETFRPVLHDSWWHGVQHGIGLIGHAAPCNYIRGVGTLYIAASYWDGIKLTCASYPTIDNFVRFFDSEVVHDLFVRRQEKVKIVTKAHRKDAIPIHLHVCWKTQTGDNCCLCEKCARTIFGLIAEGENPQDYGFSVNDKIMKKISFCAKYLYTYSFIEIPMWSDIQECIRKNTIWKESPFARYMDWMGNYSFDNVGIWYRFSGCLLRNSIRVVRKLQRILKQMIKRG